MDRVEKLAALLGIADDAQDAILAHCLNVAEGLILDYCALEEIPPRLEPVLLDLAVDGYRLGGYGQAAVPSGPVASLTEGEQSVSFAGSGGAVAAGSDAAALLRGYASRLNAYRKRRWPKHD